MNFRTSFGACFSQRVHCCVIFCLNIPYSDRPLKPLKTYPYCRKYFDLNARKGQHKKFRIRAVYIQYTIQISECGKDIPGRLNKAVFS